jgi:DNA repair protein RadC
MTTQNRVKTEDAAPYGANTSAPFADNKQEHDIIAAALAIVALKFERGEPLTSPQATRTYLQLKLHALEHEVFAVLFLDQRHRVISFDTMFTGTIDGASVYPREVVKAALKHNAAAVILAHNHPSGVAEPSQADQNITRRLQDALNLIDVRVLDHFVVGAEAVSFAERGLL